MRHSVILISIKETAELNWSDRFVCNYDLIICDFIWKVRPIYSYIIFCWSICNWTQWKWHYTNLDHHEKSFIFTKKGIKNVRKIQMKKKTWKFVTVMLRTEIKTKNNNRYSLNCSDLNQNAKFMAWRDICEEMIILVGIDNN